MKRIFVTIALLGQLSAWGDVVNVNFSGLPTDTDISTSTGVPVLQNGVTFSYEGGAALINPSSSPTFVGIQGQDTLGVLKFDFTQQATTLQFDWALLGPGLAPLSPDPENPIDGLQVYINRAGGTLNGTPPPLIAGTDGTFTYTGGPFDQAVLYFSPDATGFEVSNVLYAVPEPSTMIEGALLLVPIGGTVLFRLRKKQKA